ncbi:MAG: sugar phosphate isomerase/epimerase [Verrucomicrobia bacterium]|nr:sugar phosphate isomerase/epimerase [Verrucomicrobiota bacterium]
MEARTNIPGLGRIGIGSWTYPWAVGTVGDRRPRQPMSPSGLVRQAAELGVKVVQIADNLPLDELTIAELKDLRKLSQDYGIDLQVGTRGVDRSHLLKYLEIALQLEARLIRTMESKQGLPAPISEIETNVSLVLPEFVQADVSIALENYEAYPTSDLAHLINTINNPKLGICLDVVNSLGALESTDQILDNLASLTINLHLKDFVIQRLDHLMGFVFLGRPAGQGRLPLDQIFKRLAQFHHRPDVIVELWTPFTKTLEETLALERAWATESLQYLSTLASESPSILNPKS